MKLKDLIEQYGDYEVIDTVDAETHKGNAVKALFEVR